MKVTKALVLRVSIVAAIIAVIVVFWFVKNSSKGEAASEKAGSSLSQSESPSAAGETSVQAVEYANTEAVTPASQPVTLQASSSFIDGPLLLTKTIDLDAYRASGLPVVIDFGADSCIPCKEMAPVLVDLHDSLKGKAIVHFVDVWKTRELSEGLPIQVIPTQIFFDAEGKPFTPPESLGIPFNQYTMRDTNEHVFTTHEGGLTKPQLLAILDAMGMKK